MASQLSTSFSDFILALVSYQGTWLLWQHNKMAALGLFLIALAASFGTVRFYKNQPSSNLIRLHITLSWLGATIGIPFIAAGFAQETGTYALSHVNLAIPAAYFISHKYFSDELKAKISPLVTGIAVFSILIINTLKFNAYGLIGVISYIASGAVGTEGRGPFNFPRVDWFHYLLVLGNLAFVLALSHKSEPLFYVKH